MAGTITHEWDGTTLIITSDSGTSSMDLKGEKGDMGVRGAQGAQGCIDTSLVYTTNNPPTCADVKAAPAGYGLGTNAKLLTSADDVNTIWESGWYRWLESVPQNAPKIGADNTYGYMRVDGGQSGNAFQTVFSGYASVRGVMVQRYYASDWEYINPPMSVGTEYRTTERWNGKTVYTKLIDCGTLPAVGSVKEIGHGAGSTSDIISFNGHMSSHDSLPYINYGGVAGAAENIAAQINLSVTPSNIKLATIKWGYESTNPIAGLTAKVQIKYVKN